MIAEISLDSFWGQFIAVMVVLAPIVLPIIRYILHLGTVQAWVKKQKYGEIILELAGLAIDKVEAQVEKAKKDGTVVVSSDAKLQMAVDFVQKQAEKMKIPKAVANDDMIKASIETKLADKKSDQ